MFWLTKLFRRKPPETLDDVFRRTRFDAAQTREQIIRDGGATLGALSNVAAGYGAVVKAMEAEGLLVEQVHLVGRDPETDALDPIRDSWHYVTTCRAKAMLPMLTD